MPLRDKVWLLILLALALGALVLVASGLQDLQFAPGHLSLLRDTEKSAADFGSGWLPTRSELVELLFAVLGVLVLVLLPVSIVYVIISSDARKRVLRSLALLFWIMAAVFVLHSRPELLQQLQPETQIGAPVDDSSMPTVEFNPEAPAWLVSAATILLAALLATVIVAICWYIWRQRKRPPPSLEMLGREAQASLDALGEGADPQDTVMRCYVQMSRILDQARGLRRDEAMTPREFERNLEAAGLPRRPVRALTRLFESVRYGAKLASEREERQAVEALTAIARACGRGV